MTKTYGRIDRRFFMKFMEKIGYDNLVVDIKQGDSLSPALFILIAEVLFRAFNYLFFYKDYKCFGMPK
ncbi:hypothetical protein H5410_040820 [Solanum commersonii]|uniref:Uncharacterized protein n=1 Tax=Solanum commersonii TaxID=4109 RepID=A0A9J5XR87_SOLCO|nr:hypothetical protein H5410_040820 [Solanum commersonii]